MVLDEKKILRFGIVGCGMIAAVHAEALRSLDGAVLSGVADVKKESAEAFAARFGITAYADYAAMLADEAIDVVCICTPSGFHAENALLALQAGKHVAVEKPMAMTTADADKIMETTSEMGKLVTVISQMRFAPDVIRLKKAIDTGALGTIKLCDLYMKYWRDPSYYQNSPWKGDRALDGGVLMNQGIHGVDLLRYLMGDVHVIGSVADRLTHKIEAPDTALALVRYECGALGVIEASTAAYPGFDLRLEIIGDRGHAVFRDDYLETFTVDGKDLSKKPEGHISDGTANDPSAVGLQKHAYQLKNFISAIHGEEPLLVPGEAGRGAVALILEIYNDK